MAAANSFDQLLERVRSRRQLPAPAERRRIRESAGVSLRDVADVIGVSHTAVAAWEAGATPRLHRASYAQLLAELRAEENDERQAATPGARKSASSPRHGTG